VKRGRLLVGGSVMIVGLLVALLASTPGAWAKGHSTGSSATPFVDISSAGPLPHVYLGNELSCQVAHSGDTDLELYPPDTIPGDCGTLLVAQGDDTLYAPDFEGHGSTATGSLGSYVTFSPVSQSGVTGSGTNSDPYKVVTVADAGASLELTETDTYVIGEESYTTSITVNNTGGSSQDLILYRAGDCFLGGSDNGTGRVTGSAIACVQTQTGRIEEWIPITAGSSYLETFYDSLWAWIGGHTAFPNTCDCSDEIDNSAGLSWTFTLGAGGQQTFSQVTTFSPTGNEPLQTSKTADSPSAPPGGQDGYTITISNPNVQDVTLDTVTDTLPVGFSYVPGSTTGLTTDDPDISGQDLTWNGPFTAPGGEDVTLHFGVTVATELGEYFNEAGGTAEGFTVTPTGPTASITVGTVTSADLSIVKEDSSPTIVVGDPLIYTIDVSNAGPDDATSVIVTDPLPSELTFDSASTTQGSCSESGGTVTCDLGDLAVDASATITINTTANAAGTITNTATVSSDTSDPDLSNNSDPSTTTIAPAGGVETGAGGAAHGSTPWLFVVALMALIFAAGRAVRRTRKA
jgi:uncharacterized repeat protein (TIGR01451 family)